jgi:hypothetical protein
MFKDPDGPIESFEWGCFQIDGEIHSADGQGVGKDICVIDGVVTPWKARKGHRLEPDMISCVLESGIDVLVIGNGVNGRISVPKRTLRTIRDAGIANTIVEKTPDACATYNRLVHQGEQVALLAHGTC